MPGGRPRKPTEIKSLRGTLRPHRVNQAEPAAVGGEPVCPPWLDAIGRNEWERITGLLRAMGLLSLDVAPTVEAYCQAYSEWRLVVAAIDYDAMHVLTIGRWAQMRDRSLAQMTRLLTELGLTPASRSKVSAGAPQDADPFSDFLRRGRNATG